MDQHVKSSNFLNSVVMGTRLVNILNITHRSQRGGVVLYVHVYK